MTALSVLRDKKLLGSIAVIALPIALQNLISYMTNMLDTVMLGQLGEVALAGSALANQYGGVFMGAVFGITSGTNVLLCQYWGKGDREAMHSILAVMYRVMLGASLAATLIGRLFPYQILSLFSNDPEIIAAGAGFLQVVCYSYFFNGLASAMLMTLRSVGTVRVSIGVYLTSLVINAILNYAFIFGKLGAPHLGMTGAAVATVAARVVELALAALYIFKFEEKIRFTPRAFLRYDASFVKDYTVTVIPVLANEMLWSLGSTLLVVVMGRMGREFVSANSIANVTAYFVQVAIIGVGHSVAVLVGNTIGAQHYQKARDMGRGMTVLACLLGGGASLLFYLVRPLVVSLYNIPEATRALAMDLMLVYSVVVFFQAINFVSLMGVLRGGGDARFVLFCDVAFLWLLAVPLGFLAGLVLGWPPPAVYLVLKMDEVVKSVVATIRIWRGQWVNNLTR